MIGKTDLIQRNKKINFDVHNKRRIIFLEGIPYTISAFSKCFEIKYYRNLLVSEYDLTMVTFNSCTDTRQGPHDRNFLVRLN